MWPNPQETITEEILNGELHFLWSDAKPQCFLGQIQV